MEFENIAVVTPTRGDRKSLLNRCKYYVERQTIPVKHFVVDDNLGLDGVDLTRRIYIGLNRAKSEGYRYVFIMEDDDWYAPDYIETYLKKLQDMKVDNIFLYGIIYTDYCHLVWNKRWNIFHKGHASLYTSMMDLNYFPIEALKTLVSYKNLTADLDWELFKTKTLCESLSFSIPVKQIGIKHGVGKAGGHGHHAQHIYNPRYGSAFDYLAQHLSEEDLNYYKSKEWIQ